MTPPLISASTLAALIALDERAMPDRCTLRRPGKTGDGRGGQASTPTVLVTDVPCRVTAGGQQSSGQLTTVADKTTLVAPWIVEIPLSTVPTFNGQPTTLRPGDEVVVGVATYQVLEPIDNQSYATSLQIGCKKVG